MQCRWQSALILVAVGSACTNGNRRRWKGSRRRRKMKKSREEEKEAEEEEKAASLINLAPGGARGEFPDTPS